MVHGSWGEAQAWQDLKQEFLAWAAAKIPLFRLKSQFGKMRWAIPPHKGQITMGREMPITRDTPQKRGMCPRGREEAFKPWLQFRNKESLCPKTHTLSHLTHTPTSKPAGHVIFAFLSFFKKGGEAELRLIIKAIEIMYWWKNSEKCWSRQRHTPIQPCRVISCISDLLIHHSDESLILFLCSWNTIIHILPLLMSNKTGNLLYYFLILMASKHSNIWNTVCVLYIYIIYTTTYT